MLFRSVARWEKATNFFFDTGVEGIIVPSFTEIAGLDIVLPVPLREGYHFDGWYTGSGATLKRCMLSKAPATDVSLSARWVMATKLPALCITLQQDDGTPVALSSVGLTYYVKSVISVGGEGGINAATAEFKGRGNGSWGNPKSPYRIKFEKKQSLFGWLKTKHYTLISSAHNHPDPSMTVADSAFSLAREVFTGLEYAPRTQPVDVYVNGAYHGVYILSDKVRVEEGKVDIISEHGVDDTGYLLLYANTSHGAETPSFARIYTGIMRSPAGVNGSSQVANELKINSPDPDDVADPLMPEVTQTGYVRQVTFLRGKVQSLTAAMTSLNFTQFSNLADIASFVDGYIMQEFYRNTDVGEGGYYLYKKASSEGGKFYAGPPWDFDMTCAGGGETGIGIGNGQHQANPFITYLYAMPEFKVLVKARWKEVSPAVKEFLTERFDGYMNNAGYQAAFARNGVRWSGKEQAAAEEDWLREAAKKKKWLLDRAAWLDSEWA